MSKVMSAEEFYRQNDVVDTDDIDLDLEENNCVITIDDCLQLMEAYAKYVLSQQEKTCKWTKKTELIPNTLGELIDDNSDYYELVTFETDCHQSYSILSPTGNYCENCGGRITVKEADNG